MPQAGRLTGEGAARSFSAFSLVFHLFASHAWSSRRNAQGMDSGLQLCELHAHTTWSDGKLTLTELVDVYGRNGFDVLCITDHAFPDGAQRSGPLRLERRTYPHYLKAIQREARRAREQYGLLIIPGLELTYDHPDPDEAAHALALGLRSFDPLEAGLEDALREARRLGAALVAAHPHGREPDPQRLRTTRWFWRNHERHVGLVDRYELFNRRRTFGWVATAGLSAVAAGDFHRPTHLTTWKTLLPCRKQEDAVVDYLRSSGRAYVVPWGLRDELRGRQAA
jgi:predicted metal-dependent phosphoesterase TrpH